MRRGFPYDNGEVKGQLLNEKEIAGVIDLLRRNEVLFEAAAIELGGVSMSDIEAHRQKQCEGLTAAITEAHHQNIREWAWGLRRRVPGEFQLYRF
jgi:hypothetical protein